jgi:hypothetical protein
MSEGTNYHRGIINNQQYFQYLKIKINILIFYLESK